MGKLEMPDEKETKDEAATEIDALGFSAQLEKLGAEDAALVAMIMARLGSD